MSLTASDKAVRSPLRPAMRRFSSTFSRLIRVAEVRGTDRWPERRAIVRGCYHVAVARRSADEQLVVLALRAPGDGLHGDLDVELRGQPLARLLRVAVEIAHDLRVRAHHDLVAAGLSRELRRDC